MAGAAAALDIFGVPKWLTVPVVAIAIWGLVLFASYRVMERVFLLVMVVFLAYPVAAILATPDWAPVGQAFITPTLALNPSTILLLVAVVGTTITPYMQFYLQSAVAEKGIGEEELRLEQADAIVGSVWTNVIAVFIVVATAAAVAASGAATTITSATDAAQALEPVAGPFAQALFGIGLFGASVLAATIMPLSTAFVICEAFGWESGVGNRFRDAPVFFGIYTFVLALGAIVVLLVSESSLVPIILGSQNLQGLLLPVVLVFLVLLVNDKRLMGRYVNGKRGNALAWGAVGVVVALNAVLLITAVLGAVGVSLE
jgi:Mn2+/Fe2+ NRAMP family transporter